MSETISTNSLLLMVAAALVYPPALKALLAAESRRQVALRKLWAVTLSFAGVSWLLMYFWAQELRSQSVSIAAIACLMLALAVSYRLFSPSGCPKLAWLLLAQIGLLAYVTACWAVMSLSAAAIGGTVESQTLALAYLLLAPTLTWALLPRPQAPKAGLFVVLSALLMYAVAAWATLAFWGVFPALPSGLEPLLGILAWLVALGVLAWIVQRILRTPLGLAVSRGVARAVAGVRRLPGILQDFIRREWLVLRSAFPAGVMGLRQGLARLTHAVRAGFQATLSSAWGLLVALVGAIGFALLAFGRGVKRGAVWTVTVAPRSAARGLAASVRVVGRGFAAAILAVWHAIVWLGRSIGKAAIWSVMEGPRLAAHGVVAVLRGLGRGAARIGLALRTGLVVLGFAVGRVAVWVVRVVPRAIAHALLVSARGVRQGLSALVRGIWHGFRWLAALVGGAVAWSVTVAPRRIAIAIAAAAAADWLCCRAAVGSIWAGLRRTAFSMRRAGAWLVVGAPPAAGRWLLRALRGMWHGLRAAGRAGWHGLEGAVRTAGRGVVGVAQGLRRAIAWPVVIAAPAVAHGLVAGVRAIWHGLDWLAGAVARGMVWLIRAGLPSTARGLAAGVRAVRQGLLAVMLAITRAFLQAARSVGRGLVWMGAVGIPAGGRGIVAGVRAMWLGFLAVLVGIVHGSLVLASGVRHGVRRAVADGIPAIGHAIVAGLHVIRCGFVAILHGIARALVALGRAIVQAPGRLAVLILAAGRSFVRTAKAAVSSVLRLIARVAGGIARLFTHVIPGFARRAAAVVAAVPSRLAAGLRSGFSHQPHMRPKTVLVWGTVVFIAAAAATWISLPDDGEIIAAGPTPLPPNALGISIVTNDTKAEWLGIVTDEFNQKGVRTSAGHDIIVQMIQESSPDPTVKKIVAGELQPTIWSPADISWVEQANRLLQEQGKPPVVSAECPRVVYAATGFMMWRPMAEALGWPDKPIGWQTIVDLADDPQGWAKYGHPEWGQFKFGHTHPEQSSTGFNMLAALAYAAAGKTEGLTPEDVRSETVVEAFRKVEKDTYHYGTSTRGLTTVMAVRGPSYLHAATSSETSTLKTAEVQRDVLRFPLAFVFPAEGAFWMDNPACILEASWVSAEQREAAKLYRDYLLGFEAQDKAVEIGLRPAAPNVALHAPISLENGTDPRVSPQTVPPLANVSAETQQAIIDVFKETKKNLTVFLVLDSSNSMAGQPMRNAVAAIRNFIYRLAAGDRVEVYSFNNEVAQVGPYGAAPEVRDELAKALSRVRPGGQTALYDAICMAVRTAEAVASRDRAAAEQRLYGVVVLSDGVENRSMQKDVFQCLPSGEDVEGIKVFTIAYGKETDAKLLKKIAEQTNGKTFKSDPATIEQVYLAISAEQ